MPRSEHQSRLTLEKLQLEATQRSGFHQARLTCLIILGYVYPVFIVTLALSVLLIPLALLFALRPSRLSSILLALMASLILACLIVRIAIHFLANPGRAHEPEPDPAKARPLWDLTRSVQTALSFPEVHKIHVDINMNASVSTRKGFPIPWVSRDTHRLTLGWPFLFALSTDGIKSVLAHELAHVAGRHTSFYIRIYAVLNTWEQIKFRLDSQGKRRWLVTLLGINFFVSRYVDYLIFQTTAIKRLHEYEADRASVRATSAEETARVLITIEWLGYLTERDFWPNLFKLTADHPIPVNDAVQRMEAFFLTPPSNDAWLRFRDAALKQKTPITSNHPCLIDRLRAIGQEPLLSSSTPPCLAASAMPDASHMSALLGDDIPRLRTRVNLFWKAVCIQNWRFQHDYHQFTRRNLEKPILDPAIDHADQVAWLATLDAISRAPIHEEFTLLKEFIHLHPAFAEARFHHGSLLLRWDDPAAFAELEEAARLSSYHILPSLQVMLEYYRAAGRDDEAEPYRLRILAHIKTLEQAQTERITVTRRDTLTAPDIGPIALARVQSALKLAPRVSKAYLVQKSVRHLTDRKTYVLGIHVPWRMIENYNQSSAQVANYLQAQMPFDCVVVVFGPFNPILKKRILAAAPHPIYQA